ncbi:hypothetical protein [Streptomyces sp. UNOC14_S4]|uniref:hypothetical protein n=1 Tax=Streptomyces sp. UNOC14_S4 TaxID=2872340 RepID=UPI001E418908|nr:hypothetical protein [Streptomyces sp. UNOC14_S4]MCC3771075.1 hypothetical protein [Streptomyces sp. UNOC14_S4]
MTRASRKSAVSRSALVGALLVLTACGGSKGHDGAIPESLCDVKVEPDLVKPLLPTGKKFHYFDSGDGKENRLCQLYVGGEKVFDIDNTRSLVKRDAMTYAHMSLYGLENTERAAIGDDGVLADNGAYIVNSCTYQGKKMSYVLYIHVSQTKEDYYEGLYAGKHLKLRPEVLRFAKAYLPGGAKVMGCAT